MFSVHDTNSNRYYVIIIMGELVNLEELFFASKLVEVILEKEITHLQERTALVALGKQLALSSYSTNMKIFNFEARSQYSNVQIGILRLRIIKGSVFTYIWNTFARVDDEYALEYECNTLNASVVTNAWELKGMDPWNSKIVSANVNWTNIRNIYHGMGITTIGVLAFARLLGRVILSLPNYYKEQYFLAPMPVAFM